MHNLRRTFGRRLRSAGIPLETRKALLGHANGDITTHYSAAELQELIDAAEAIANRGEREDYYNYHSPHGALQGRTPYERLIEKSRADVSPGS